MVKNKVVVSDILKKVGYAIQREYKSYNGAIEHYTNMPSGNCYTNCGNMNSLSVYIKENKGEVIAYNINPLGIIFMFKGARKIFCYAILKDIFWFGGHGYRTTRIDYKTFFKVLTNKETKILNKGLYEKTQVLDTLEKI